MKKSILKLGEILNKKKQKTINGGSINPVNSCICNRVTGNWNNPSCGTTCREDEAPDLPDSPIDINTFCIMYPNDPFC